MGKVVSTSKHVFLLARKQVSTYENQFVNAMNFVSAYINMTVFPTETNVSTKGKYIIFTRNNIGFHNCEDQF